MSDTLNQLRDQWGRLASSASPAAGRVIDQAAAPVRSLLSYAELATKYAPQAFDLWDRLTARGRQAMRQALPTRREPPLRPVLVWTAAALLASFVAYSLARTRPNATPEP